MTLALVQAEAMLQIFARFDYRCTCQQQTSPSESNLLPCHGVISVFQVLNTCVQTAKGSINMPKEVLTTGKHRDITIFSNQSYEIHYLDIYCHVKHI